MTPSIGLPPEKFAQAFPFHLGLDRQLRFVQAGATVRRICPDIVPGAALNEIFRPIRPEGEISRAWLLENRHRFFLLEHRATELKLRGEFMLVDNDERVLFLGSPWLTDTSEIPARGLGFDDFALHDPVVDLLQVFQANKLALADAKKLAAKLTAQRAELRAINARLRQQEVESRKLAIIAARTDNAVVLTDSSGLTVWLNEGFTRMTGYGLEEVAGKNPGSVLRGPYTDPETLERIRQRILRGEGFEGEILIVGKDEQNHWLAVEGQPIHDEGGNLTNFIAIGRDISAAKEAERALLESRQRLELALNGADLGLWDWNVRSGKLTINDRWATMLGYRPGELEAHVSTWEQLLHPEDKARAVGQHEAHFQGGTPFYECEHRLRAKSGKWVWVLSRGRVVERDAEGRPLRMVGTHLDTSARQAAQQRISIQLEVSRVLTESEDLAAALPRFLMAICINLGWPVGQFWAVHGEQMHLVESLQTNPNETREFVQLSRQTHFRIGVGLPGRVWKAGKPIWVPDFAGDAAFPRRFAADRSGLHGAFAFPVHVRGKLRGVAEFFSHSMEQPDETLLKTFMAVGDQIGQFIVRREAEEELQTANALQRAILKGATYSIISTALDGTIGTFNAAAETMLGYSSEEVVGKETPALFHDPAEMEDRAAELSRELGRKVSSGFEALVTQAALGKPDEREWTYVRKDGSRFPALLSVTALFEERGAVTGYLVVASDITESKRVASELLKAKDLAEAANRAKSDFLAVMSHEIRTPMNAVLGMTNLLLGTALDSHQRELTETVARSGEALIEIINDILDFSKIESGEHFQLEEEVFSIRGLVDGVIQILRPRAEAKGIGLSVELASQTPDTLKGDDGRLRQVLLNLVANGIKFTDQGGVSIAVRSIGASESRATLRFEVTDTGIGIKAQDLSRLFQPFVQADSSASRRRGGTGLGLAISKRIVERMGGNIAVDSKPGHGSQFCFQLEFELAADRQSPVGVLAPTQLRTSQPGRPLRVLIADDNDSNRRLAMLQLDRLGHRADFAANGIEAVEAWEHFDHEVILMDCQMPEMDGFEATREIRRREAALEAKRGHRVRIIALTANALKGDRERCLAAGMDSYLSKPFTAQQLMDVLGPGGPPSKPRAVDSPKLDTEPSPGFDRRRPDQLWTELGPEDTKLVIEDFLRDLPCLADRIASLAEMGRMKELARSAHSLQGIGQSLGLEGLVNRLRSLEAAVNTEETAMLTYSIRSLPGEVEKGAAALRAWLSAQRT